MSETRPTREECIKWVRMEAIFANCDSGKDAFVKETIAALAEATIHYLTDSATPDLFAQGEGEETA